jgi:hypothetical protein
MDDQNSFRTLRGFLDGNEPDEEPYFAYSATLRISGHIPDLDAITRTLGLAPTQALHKGDRVRPRSAPLNYDCWHYQPLIPESEHLALHINALWAAIKPNRDYIKALKSQATVDVFLGYRTNCDHAGLELPYQCMELFTELEIAFGVSIIIA